MLDLKKISAALGDLASEEARLRGRLEACLQRREDLHTLPLPREDFTAQICEYLDGAKNPLIDRLRPQFKDRLNRPMEYFNYSQGGFKPLSWPVAEGIPSDVFHFIFKKEIKAAITDAMKQWDWPKEVGPTRAERAVEIAQLDAEIHELHQQLEQLIVMTPGRQAESMRKFKP